MILKKASAEVGGGKEEGSMEELHGLREREEYRRRRESEGAQWAVVDAEPPFCEHSVQVRSHRKLGNFLSRPREILFRLATSATLYSNCRHSILR